MDRLRVALADDEPLARERLARLLEQCGCEVVADFKNGKALLAWLKEGAAVDALFLDVQMPGITGLEVLCEIGETIPTIFITAFPDHAVRAFELAAVDFLVKPVFSDRLERSVERLRARRAAGPAPQDPGAARPPADRFPAKAGEGFVFLELRKVTHFELDQAVVWACVGSKRFRTSWYTLGEVETAFPDSGFLRIQRHLLLRPSAVVGLRRLRGGRALVRVGEGLEMEVSRTSAPALRRFLGLAQD